VSKDKISMMTMKDGLLVEAIKPGKKWSEQIHSSSRFYNFSEV